MNCQGEICRLTRWQIVRHVLEFKRMIPKVPAHSVRGEFLRPKSSLGILEVMTAIVMEMNLYLEGDLFRGG